jgi:hypothetical protein
MCMWRVTKSIYQDTWVVECAFTTFWMALRMLLNGIRCIDAFTQDSVGCKDDTHTEHECQGKHRNHQYLPNTNTQLEHRLHLSSLSLGGFMYVRMHFKPVVLECRIPRCMLCNSVLLMDTRIQWWIKCIRLHIPSHHIMAWVSWRECSSFKSDPE